MSTEDSCNIWKVPPPPPIKPSKYKLGTVWLTQTPSTSDGRLAVDSLVKLKPFEITIATSRVFDDSDVIKKYNCLFEDLRKQLPSLLPHDSIEISPTVKVAHSKDELIEVLDQIVDASKRDINHRVALGYSDGCAVLCSCFLEASKSFTNVHTASPAAPIMSFVTALLQKSSLCLSNLSSAAANRAKLSHLGISSAVLDTLLSIQNATTTQPSKVTCQIIANCLELISNMACSPDERSRMGQLNIALVLASTIERGVNHSSYDIMTSGFLTIGNLCTYNAQNRKNLGNECLIGLTVAALGKAIAAFSTFGDSISDFDTTNDSIDVGKNTLGIDYAGINNTSIDNTDVHNTHMENANIDNTGNADIDDTDIDDADIWLLMRSNLKVSTAALFAIEKLAYNNIVLQDVLDDFKFCNVIVTLLHALNAALNAILRSTPETLTGASPKGLAKTAGRSFEKCSSDFPPPYGIERLREGVSDFIIQAIISINTIATKCRSQRRLLQELGTVVILKSCVRLARLVTARVTAVKGNPSMEVELLQVVKALS